MTEMTQMSVRRPAAKRPARLRRARVGPGTFRAFMRAICVICVICGPGIFSASPAAQAPRPQFEARAELVLVDVTVVDRDGNPASDLSEADFEIEINGQPRTIQSLQFVSTTPDPTAVPVPREAAYSTNEAPTSGRLLLFVIDEGNMRLGSGRTVLRTAQLLMDRLAPGDLVALARLPTGVGGVEFTTDRGRIAAALQRVTGSVTGRATGSHLRISEAHALDTGDTILWQQAIDRECAGETGVGLEACVSMLETEARSMVTEVSARARTTVEAFESLFERLVSLDTPVNVVMISEGLFLGRDRLNMNTLARRAAEARATLHIVRPGQSFFDIEARSAPGLGSFFDDSLLSEGLEQFAAQTRGTLSQIGGGSGAGVFERLGRELSGYYLIGFEPTQADRTGRERRIRVQVARRDLRVRARPTFVIRDSAPTAAASADKAPTASATADERLKEMLGAPLPTRGLPLRVASFTATNAGDARVRVILAAEIGDPASDVVEWRTGLLVIDKNDNVVASNLAPTKLMPASPREASRPLLLTSVLLEPGEYTLRLAAIDGEGRAGSVHHSIDARFRRGPGKLQTSDLVLASAPVERGETPRPTASAEIDAETAQAMIEMTAPDDRALARARVRMQIATAESGDALVSTDARAASRGEGQRAFAATLRLRILPPGEYVVRAIISVPGEDDTTIARHFRLAPVASASTTTADAAADPRIDVDPDAPPVPPPPSRILAPVPKFLPELVMRPEVVAPFLEGLLELHPPSGAVAPIVENARRGVYTAPDVDVRMSGDDELTLAFIRGLGALQKHQLAQATAWFQQTANGASDFLGAAFYLGACHAASGRDPEAIGAWQLALLSENPAAVYPLLVDALLRVGDGRQAADVLAEAPTAWADENERLRREATADAMLGDFTSALPKLTALVDETPAPDPSLLFLTIQVLYRLHVDSGGLDEAKKGRFAQYVAQYERAKGADLALVETWKKFVLR
jgi:VWFA-related protein